MTPKQIEQVMAAAHVVCGPHKDLSAVNDAHADLAKALALADPLGVYKPDAPDSTLAQCPAGDFKKARECPRLPRLPSESTDAT